MALICTETSVDAKCNDDDADKDNNNDKNIITLIK